VVAEFNVFPPMDHPQLGASVTAVMPPDAPTCLPKDVEQAHEDRSMAPGGDRSTLRLSAADEALIASARMHSSNVVVCVMAGSAVVMPWASDVDALIMLWYPGMEGGNALGEVLSGVDEPGGRLPFAVPRHESDLVHFDRDATEETYDLFHGQWKLDREGTDPHFAFGAGFGYTTWQLTHRVDHDDRISVEVKNTGGRVGSTVVMVMGSVPTSAYERPVRRLVGFARVTSEPGATGRVDVPIDVSALDVRIDGHWLREAQPVEYTVMISGLVTDSLSPK
jgi:beta-glucosidase